MSWLQTGPFIGMRDSLDPTSSQTELACLLRNCYPVEPHLVSRVAGRPGFNQMGAQLGSGGDVQFIGQFTKLDGTEYTIAIVGGQFYTLNWGTSTWTEVLTAANLSAASVTLDPSARVYAEVMADQIGFTDGVNTPWIWDGTTNGGVTLLSSVPVAYGPPTIHYGKAFWIKNADRATFVWSEEGSWNTGYEVGGFNNSWTLRQTDQNALTRLLGANEALYVFRERSITEILGEVNSNFASAGTRESVSETTGTAAPASVFFDDTDVFFADADGRPHIIRPGSRPVSIWEDFAETLRGMDVTKFDEIEGYWDPTLELAILAYEEINQTERSRQLCYHSTGGEIPHASSVFDGYTFTRVGVVKDGDGDPVVMHGSTDGYLYVHGTPDGTIWDDGFNAGDQPIEHEVCTNFIAYDEGAEAHFSRGDFIFLTRSDISITARVTTNSGLGATQTIRLEGSHAKWDEAVWDTDVWTGPEIQHGEVGFNDYGRYAKISLSHKGGAERFGFVSGRVQGRSVGTYARVS